MHLHIIKSDIFFYETITNKTKENQIRFQTFSQKGGRDKEKYQSNFDYCSNITSYHKVSILL